MRHATSAVAISVMLAACTAAAEPEPTSPVDDVVNMSASWAYDYDTLDDLGRAADLVVEGQVVKIKSSGPDPATPDVPQTLFGVEVIDLMKGDAPDQIIVKQTGGTIDGVSFVMEGDPMLTPGDHVLLYLARVWAPNKEVWYLTLGGPQGRLAVGKDGSLATVGDPAIELPREATLRTAETRLGS